MILFVVMLILSACAATRLSVLPIDIASQAEVTGFSQNTIRLFGDSSLVELSRLSFDNIPELKSAGGLTKEQNFLILSGGGANGAFGAGLLNGWSESGTRPEFQIVTGVSTGAIIAPFAFLGSEYDPYLRKFYTQYSTKDLLRRQILAGLAGGSSLASSAPLAKLIEEFITPEIMAKIAREYETGRFLLVGTTNLDLQRPVIWNMGEIARQGDEKALKLFRTVIRASISIPAAFEPVLIDVTAAGEIGQELHVDGGTTDNAILVPLHVNTSPSGYSQNSTPSRKMFVVINSNLKPKPEIVKNSTFSVAVRSLDTLLKQQTEGDVLRLYNYAERNRIDFNYAEIPSSFTRIPEEVFDKDYMQELFAVGEELGKSGYQWQKKPTGF